MGYAEWLWEKFGKKLQPIYNRIDDWDWPELRELCRSIWNQLPGPLQKSIYALVTALVVKYGVEKAKEIVAKLIGTLTIELKLDN